LKSFSSLYHPFPSPVAGSAYGLNWRIALVVSRIAADLARPGTTSVLLLRTILGFDAEGVVPTVYRSGEDFFRTELILLSTQ